MVINFWRYIAVALLALVAFGASSRSEMLYDDQRAARALRGVEGFADVAGWLRQPAPLRQISLMLESRAGATTNLARHSVSLLCHAAAAMLLLALLRRLLNHRPAATWAAGLFALLPTGASAVGVVAHRNEIFGLMLILLACMAWLRPQRGWRAWTAGGACAALAVMETSMALLLPCLLAAYELLLARPNQPGPARPRLVAVGVAAVAVLAAQCAWRWWGDTSGFILQETWESLPAWSDWPARIVRDWPSGVIEALRWLVLPWPFDVDHGLTPSPWWETILGWLGIAALGALIYRQARLRPWVAFGIAWVLAGCGVAALDVLRHQYGAILEQKLYLIAPGLCLLGGLLAERVCQFDAGSLERAGTLVAISELMAVMMICAGAAVIWLLPDLMPKAVQSSPRSATGVWAAVVAVAWLLIFARQLRPEPRLVTATAWQICILEFAVLGAVVASNWRAMGFSSEAAMLRETLANHRDSGYAHLALGRLLLDARQDEPAGKQFLLAAANGWNYYETFGNLGEVAMKRRDFKRAENCYREALRLNPKGAGAQLRLANALHGQKRYAEARAIYLELLKGQPHPLDLYELLAETYMAENRLQEANNVLRPYPGSFKARLRLATMLHQQKRYSDAREIYKQLIAEQPRIARLYELLAAAYDAEDRVYEAQQALKQARRLAAEAATQGGAVAGQFKQ